MVEEKIILSENAETLLIEKNVTVWVTPDNRHFLSKESAINNTITHKKCECGNLMKRYQMKCDSCSFVSTRDKYNKLRHMDWDGETPLCLFDDDVFFFSEDEIYDYIENLDYNADDEDKTKVEDLMLVICTPNHAPEIDYLELCEDILPDTDHPERLLSKELSDKLAEVNKLISEHKPISWSGGPFRTTIKKN
jgi:hypothetical protein